MHKIVILTPVLAMLGVGNAAAFDAAWGFGPSEANDLPAPRFQSAPALDRSAVTSSVGDASGSYGYTSGADGSAALPAATGRTVGFSAAQGFGPSDENNQPVPRFQIAR